MAELFAGWVRLQNQNKNIYQLYSLWETTNENAQSRSPIYFSFLRRVDLRQLNAFVVEKDLHIVEQELVRIGIRNVQTEVVDKLFLLLLPLGPAILAHLGTDLLPQVSWNRGKTKRFVLQPASGAFEFVTRK